MMHSKEYKDWQNNLNQLTYRYDIELPSLNEEHSNFYALIAKAEVSILAHLKPTVEGEFIKEVFKLIKMSGATVLKLFEVLKILFDKNLITIDEYHRQATKLINLSYTIEKFLLENNFVQNDAGESKVNTPTGNSFYNLN